MGVRRWFAQQQGDNYYACEQFNDCKRLTIIHYNHPFDSSQLLSVLGEFLVTEIINVVLCAVFPVKTRRHQDIRVESDRPVACANLGVTGNVVEPLWPWPSGGNRYSILHSST